MKTLALLVAIVIAGIPPSVRAQDGAFLAHNDVVVGAELYRIYCATCHGVDGRGDGPTAEALKRRPSNLTTIARRNGGKFPEFRITHIIDGYEIKVAHGSREMPIWGEFFHDMKRDDTLLKLREHNLVEYVRSIQR